MLNSAALMYGLFCVFLVFAVIKILSMDDGEIL